MLINLYVSALYTRLLRSLEWCHVRLKQIPSEPSFPHILPFLASFKSFLSTPLSNYKANIHNQSNPVTWQYDALLEPGTVYDDVID